MLLYIIIWIGPLNHPNCHKLQTKNYGERSFNSYAHEEFIKCRIKNWKVTMWVTIFAWIISYFSSTIIDLFEDKQRIYVIVIGEWSGLLFTKDVPDSTFFYHVLGYLIILFLLVIEKFCITWLEIRRGAKNFFENKDVKKFISKHDPVDLKSLALRSIENIITPKSKDLIKDKKLRNSLIQNLEMKRVTLEESKSNAAASKTQEDRKEEYQMEAYSEESSKPIASPVDPIIHHPPNTPSKKTKAKKVIDYAKDNLLVYCYKIMAMRDCKN